MRFRFLSFALLPVLVAACSDSAGPAAQGDALTRAEALLIAGDVSGSVSETSALVAPTGPDRVAGDPLRFTQEHTATRPCPRGGTVQLSWKLDGLIDPEAGVFELDLEGTHQPAACAYPHQNITLTVTGDPAIEFAAHMAASNRQPSGPFTVNIDGAFNWSASDGRSGRCTVAYTEVTDLIARTRTIDGNVCGHTIKETLSWGS